MVMNSSVARIDWSESFVLYSRERNERDTTDCAALQVYPNLPLSCRAKKEHLGFQFDEGCYVDLTPFSPKVRDDPSKLDQGMFRLCVASLRSYWPS